MRLFVALQISPEVRELLAALIQELRALAAQPRWVRPENLHLTLKFIGEAEPARLDAIRSALAKIRSDQPVSIHFRGLGFFPSEKQPRVFWVDMDGSPNLKTMAGEIEGALAAVGVAREQRPFSPHLTLARLPQPRLPQELRAGIQKNAARDFGAFQTKEFHLIESKTKPAGAEYTTLQTFSFVAEA